MVDAERHVEGVEDIPERSFVSVDDRTSFDVVGHQSHASGLTRTNERERASALAHHDNRLALARSRDTHTAVGGFRLSIGWLHVAAEVRDEPSVRNKLAQGNHSRFLATMPSRDQRKHIDRGSLKNGQFFD